MKYVAVTHQTIRLFLGVAYALSCPFCATAPLYAKALAGVLRPWRGSRKQGSDFVTS
jgi:hypothetical protein